METTSINLGRRPASVNETPFSLHVAEVVLMIQQKVNTKVRNIIKHATFPDALLIAGCALLGAAMGIGARTLQTAGISTAIICAAGIMMQIADCKKGGAA